MRALGWIIAAVGIVLVLVATGLIGDQRQERRERPGGRVGAGRLRRCRRLAR